MRQPNLHRTVIEGSENAFEVCREERIFHVPIDAQVGGVSREAWITAEGTRKHTINRYRGVDGMERHTLYVDGIGPDLHFGLGARHLHSEDLPYAD